MKFFQQFLYPQLPYDFFGFGRAVFIAGEAYEIGLAVLLKKLSFQPLNIFGLEQRQAVLGILALENLVNGELRHFGDLW